MKLTVHFDGSYGPGRRQKNTAAYGYLVRDEERNILHSASGRAVRGPQASCNVAEYSGLIAAMEWILGHYPEAEVLFVGDSTLVISQMRGESRAKKGKYVPYHHKAKALAANQKLWSFEWTPRGMNSEADALAQYHRY